MYKDVYARNARLLLIPSVQGAASDEERKQTVSVREEEEKKKSKRITHDACDHDHDHERRSP